MNWIVHNKSIVDDSYTKVKVLRWHLTQGEKLRISQDMFSSLIDEINLMAVAVGAV